MPGRCKIVYHYNIPLRYVVIKSAFTPEKAEEWMTNMWVRLGLDPNDKSTWHSEKIHMPAQRREPVANFAPKVRILENGLSSIAH